MLGLPDVRQLRENGGMYGQAKVRSEPINERRQGNSASAAEMGRGGPDAPAEAGGAGIPRRRAGILTTLTCRKRWAPKPGILPLAQPPLLCEEGNPLRERVHGPVVQ